MLDEFEDRRIEAGDSELFLRVGGKGPPLLLLHGYPQTHVAWHRVAPALAREFSLVIPDLPGYGASRGPMPDPEHHNYSKRAMARVMVELMTELGHERFFLAGHDRGARVGYRLCLDHPGRVERVAVLDIVPTWNAWQDMDADRALSTYHWQFLAVPAPVPERLIGNDPGFYVKHLLERWAGELEKLNPRAVSAYVEQFHLPSVIAATCEDYRAGAGLDRIHDEEDRRLGHKIGCPVLVIWGRGYLTNKTSSPLEIWRQWADEVEEVAIDCGHFVAEEAPEACAEALACFFNRTSSLENAEG